MSDIHGVPYRTPFSMGPLPDDWSRPLFILLPWLVCPALFALHAWYTSHKRLHGFPPLIFMGLATWFRRRKGAR